MNPATFRQLDRVELDCLKGRLSHDGYAIVPQFLDPAGCDQVLASLQELHARQDFGDNDFTGTRTKRVFNLFAKTRVLDALLVEPNLLDLVHHMLGPGARLSIASTMEIHAGETAQALHQDDAYFPERPHPALVVNTIWALTDFTKENGGTCLVPGSHRQAGPVDPAARSVAAEMPRGSVLLWDGAVWHGGGPNMTETSRFGLSLNYCRGWIRQQENQYLSLDPAMVLGLPEDVQKLLGYDICEFLGWADGRHPMRAIIPEVRKRVYAGMRKRRS
ncbi:phytanoyl-CoA dioxygenase family protein [Novosphingopyxis sp.]|uniref:phytanoyl-CoA dioxygenase family protein n=1 Tax=Novosphingopyxis sp. TaxID=2709690 RepID=UPI003B59482E